MAFTDEYEDTEGFTETEGFVVWLVSVILYAAALCWGLVSMIYEIQRLRREAELNPSGSHFPA